MSRRTPDGTSRLVLVPEDVIADIDNPTATELNDVAAVVLHNHALEWDFPASDQPADASDMGDSFNKQELGTWGGDSGYIEVYRDTDDDEDAPWQSLPRETRGVIVERLLSDLDCDDPFEDGDHVNLYRGVVSNRPASGARQRNNMIRSRVNWLMNARPLEHVLVGES